MSGTLENHDKYVWSEQPMKETSSSGLTPDLLSFFFFFKVTEIKVEKACLSNCLCCKVRGKNYYPGCLNFLK